MDATGKSQSSSNGDVKGKWNVFLYFCVASANIASFSVGTVFGWSSPAIPKLNGQSDAANNPLSSKLTSEEESWVVSLLTLGATLGPVFSGALVDRIGRKKTLLLSAFPMIACFTIKTFSTSVSPLYLARFLGGISSGFILSVVPMYAGEVAEAHNRGRLGCLMSVFISLGQLFSFCLGPYIHLRLLCSYCVVAPVIFLIVFTLFAPESPYYLIRCGRHKEAQESLLKLRLGNAEKTKSELAEIAIALKESSQGGSLRNIIKKRWFGKALLLCMGMMVFQQLTGITVVVFYLQSIFIRSGSTTISSELSAIVVGITQTTGCVFASIIVEKLGRRFLLLASAFGVSLTLSGLATYFYLKAEGTNVAAIFWLPITCVIACIAAFNVGYGPLPFAILGEIFPPNVKSVATTSTVCVSLMSAFCTTKFFPSLVDLVGYHYSFWFFSTCTVISAIFIFVLLPETRGKTLQDILEELNGKKPITTE